MTDLFTMIGTQIGNAFNWIISIKIIGNATFITIMIIIIVVIFLIKILKS